MSPKQTIEEKFVPLLWDEKKFLCVLLSNVNVFEGKKILNQYIRNEMGPSNQTEPDEPDLSLGAPLTRKKIKKYAGRSEGPLVEEAHGTNE